MRITLSIAALALMMSCAQRSSVHVKATRPLTTEETRIIEIARQAVATNDTWVAKAEFDLPMRRDRGWIVVVRRLPLTPGAYRWIEIDENKRVSAYYGGR